MFNRRSIVFGLSLTWLLLSSIGGVRAATGSITELTYATPYPNVPGCDGSLLVILYNAAFDTADFNGYDEVASIIFDSNGNVIVTDLTSIMPVDQSNFGGAHPMYSLNPIPHGPVQGVLYDILPAPANGPVNGGSWPDWIIANSVILDTTTLAEPDGGWPQCGELAPGGTIFNPDDGRLNPDAAAPAAFYAPDDGSLQVYGIDAQSHGYLAIYISSDEVAALPASPEENLKIAESDDGKIALYKLTTGEYQVNAGPDFEGKVFVYIFGNDPLALVKSYTE